MSERVLSIKLLGRVILHCDIETVTGLRIGGSDTGIEIGGVDNTVIRDPLTNQPYIPGSSLRGKMRSLTEKAYGKEQNWRINRGFIHACRDAKPYADCEVCRIYGVPADQDFSTPTRLLVRDVALKAGEPERLRQASTDMPYTEIKTEVAIDRVTSVANPRQVERVPRGVLFGPAEMVYSIYDGDRCDPSLDIAQLRILFQGLQLVEDDYLGGMGSRGHGRVRFCNLTLALKRSETYAQEPVWLTPEPLSDLAALHQRADALVDAIQDGLLLRN